MARAGGKRGPGASPVEGPEGLAYREDVVTDEEQRALVAAFDASEFSEVRMHGRAAHRSVLHFGYRYDYEAWALVPADPLPSDWAWLCDRVAALAEVEPAELAEVLVSRYPPGAGIGWHMDAPLFGPKVVGVSLVSPCTMRFRRRAGSGPLVHRLELAPQSAYVLSGPARSSWQHSIPPVNRLRYSVTFRTLRRRAER